MKKQTKAQKALKKAIRILEKAQASLYQISPKPEIGQPTDDILAGIVIDGINLAIDKYLLEAKNALVDLE